MSRKKSYFVNILGVSDRIRKIRGELTQTEFAKMIGVTQGTVQKYEKKGVVPNEETLKKIANYGGVTLEYLLRGPGAAERPPHLRDLGQEEYVATLNPLETALLIEVVTTVEEVITQHRLQLTPDQKARLFIRTYDDCRAQHLTPTHHHIEKLLYLVD